MWFRNRLTLAYEAVSTSVEKVESGWSAASLKALSTMRSYVSVLCTIGGALLSGVGTGTSPGIDRRGEVCGRYSADAGAEESYLLLDAIWQPRNMTDPMAANTIVTSDILAMVFIVASLSWVEVHWSISAAAVFAQNKFRLRRFVAC